MKIFKYFLAERPDDQTVLMPMGARVLTVQDQIGSVCLWALVNDAAKEVERVFRIVGTGHEFDDCLAYNHIGTVQQDEFVWHVFEKRTRWTP